MRHLHEGHNFGGVSEKALCGALISHNYGWAVCGECLDKAARMAQRTQEPKEDSSHTRYFKELI